MKIKNENGRYTQEFLQAVNTCISEGKTAGMTAKELGVDPFNSGFRQLFYKLKKDLSEGVSIKRLNAKTVNSEEIHNIKDDGIVIKTADEVVIEKPRKTTQKTKASARTKTISENKIDDETLHIDRESKVQTKFNSESTIKDASNKEYKTIENSVVDEVSVSSKESKVDKESKDFFISGGIDSSLKVQTVSASLDEDIKQTLIKIGVKNAELELLKEYYARLVALRESIVSGGEH